MALNNTYFETKGKDVTTPIPDTPGYDPPVVPDPPTPSPGSVPSINRPVFTGNVSFHIYNNPCERNFMHKENYLAEITSGILTLKEDCSVVNPVIYINTDTDLTTANYLKLGDYFYFISCECLPGSDGNKSLYRLTGKRDALTSFKNDILYLNVIVDKNQYDSNMYLNDGSFITESRENIQLINFSGGFNDSGTHILIAAGG